MTSLQSTSHGSSLEEEKAKKEDGPSSSHISVHPETIQTKKNPATVTSTRQHVQRNSSVSCSFPWAVVASHKASSQQLRNVSCVRVQQGSPPRSDAHDAEATGLPQETSDLK